MTMVNHGNSWSLTMNFVWVILEKFREWAFSCKGLCKSGNSKFWAHDISDAKMSTEHCKWFKLCWLSILNEGCYSYRSHILSTCDFHILHKTNGTKYENNRGHFWLPLTSSAIMQWTGTSINHKQANIAESVKLPLTGNRAA